MQNLNCPVDSKYQNTLNNSLTFSGITLHKGIISNIQIKPSQEDTGISFIRTDAKNNNIIKAHYLNVSETNLCTKLSNNNGISISTVEHLMAAFIGFGIDNALVEVDGPELPILDGSSAPFVNAFKRTGIKTLNQKRKVINVLKKVSIIEKDRFITLEPNNFLSVNMEINHDCKLINSQSFSFDLQGSLFEDQLMSARTYGFKEHASMLIKKGLALGASENNALVFNGDTVLNNDGLRYFNEPVRHKILDCLGDFFMAGYRINGKINAYKSGHELNNKLIHALFTENENWELKTIDSENNINHNNQSEKIAAIA